MSVESPCTRHCGLNTDGICVGCGRTVRQLRIWSKCDDEEKLKIRKESSERLSSMQKLRDDGFLSDT